MFKLVVLCALVSITVAKPSYLHGALEVAAPIVAQSYVSPAAVSSTYREDIISQPAAVAYAAIPSYAEKTIVAEPVIAKQVAVPVPVVAKTVVAPAAVSHTYREDIISKPAFVAYAAAPAPAYVEKTIVAQPDVAQAVVAESVVAKAVVTEPVAVAAPVVTKTVVAPAAVSQTYREDVTTKNAAIAYASPAVFAAPVVQKTFIAAPVAYSAPVAHTYEAYAPAVYSAQAPIVQAW